MKYYLKFIKRFYFPLFVLAIIGLIYFGLNGVKAELTTKKNISQKTTSLADRPLNIVAVDNAQTQNVASHTPNPTEGVKTVEIPQSPEVKNIPAASTQPPQTKVTMRINAGSAAGNYPVDFVANENAYQFLLRIAAANHFLVQAKDYGWGIYVEGIGNLWQDGRDNFWFFYINGKLSEVGAAGYIVAPNDLIEWRYHEYWIY